MKKLAISLLLAWLLSDAMHGQDTTAFHVANSRPPTERIAALEEFVKQYPESKLKTRAYEALFDLHLEESNEEGALTAAHNALLSLPPANRMSPYNRFAWNLAVKNIGLDSALAYIDRGIEMAGTSRSLSGFQDTKAYVLYRLGRVADAEKLQLIALKGHESDPELLSHLALFEQGNGKSSKALNTMAKALYLGADQESKQHFLDWISQAEKTEEGQAALKKFVVMNAINPFIDTLKGPKLIAARSNAATVMADLDVELETAKNWAETAVKTLDKKSTLNNVISFNQSLALVLSSQGKYDEAITYLRAIEGLVDPYDARFWNVLGKTYEQLGDRRKAIDAYLSGLIARSDKQLLGALEPLFIEEFGSLESMNRMLDSLRTASAEVHPGHYPTKKTSSGKVVLAELFTGAECGPCVSSDLAFDALSEFYPRTVVAIIEYHAHIPGPDPLTTDDSWDRYIWYEGQGTPTVVIDGREQIIGGGSKTVTKNRYGVYRYAIQKFEDELPRAHISVRVNSSGDNITVEANIKRTSATARVEKPVLHVALVERFVDYTGANGISKHAFVVRKMFGDANGTPLQLNESGETISKQVNVGEVEKSITGYLDNPTAQRSWSNRRPFAGWRARPENIDRSNLAIVAWVQDMESKEVLQAVYENVPTSLGVK